MRTLWFLRKYQSVLHPQFAFPGFFNIGVRNCESLQSRWSSWKLQPSKKMCVLGCSGKYGCWQILLQDSLSSSLSVLFSTGCLLPGIMAADEQLSAELAGKRSEPLLGCCRMSIACRCLEIRMLGNMQCKVAGRQVTGGCADSPCSQLSTRQWAREVGLLLEVRKGWGHVHGLSFQAWGQITNVWLSLTCMQT